MGRFLAQVNFKSEEVKGFEVGVAVRTRNECFVVDQIASQGCGDPRPAEKSGDVVDVSCVRLWMSSGGKHRHRTTSHANAS